MTYEEVKSILTRLRTTYPQSFSTFSEEDSAILLDTWMRAFAKDDPQLVKAAVWEIIAKTPAKFAPTPGEVRVKMVEMRTRNDEETPEELFGELRGVLRRLPSDRADECMEYYEALPPLVKKIYTVHDLIDLAFHRTIDELVTYERPRFIKALSTLQDSSKAQLAYSPTGLSLPAAGGPKQISGGGGN